MIGMLARSIAARAGLISEWAVHGVEHYFVYLVKTLIRFGIGCTVSGIFAWYTFQHHNPVTAILSIVFLFASFALLMVITSPVTVGLEWISSKFDSVRRVYFAFADMIFATLLAIFYIVADQLHEVPWLFVSFTALLALFFAITVLPKTPLVSFAYGRIKWPVMGMVAMATIWQHGLTANQKDQLALSRKDVALEVLYDLRGNALVDAHGNALDFSSIDRSTHEAVPHHGGYQDHDGLWHIVIMHAGEKEVGVQGYQAHDLSNAEIAAIRNQKQKEARESRQAAAEELKKQQTVAEQQRKQEAARLSVSAASTAPPATPPVVPPEAKLVRVEDQPVPPGIWLDPKTSLASCFDADFKIVPAGLRLKNDVTLATFLNDPKWNQLETVGARASCPWQNDLPEVTRGRRLQQARAQGRAPTIPIPQGDIKRGTKITVRTFGTYDRYASWQTTGTLLAQPLQKIDYGEQRLEPDRSLVRFDISGVKENSDTYTLTLTPRTIFPLNGAYQQEYPLPPTATWPELTVPKPKQEAEFILASMLQVPGRRIPIPPNMEIKFTIK